MGPTGDLEPQTDGWNPPFEELALELLLLFLVAVLEAADSVELAFFIGVALAAGAVSSSFSPSSLSLSLSSSAWIVKAPGGGTSAAEGANDRAKNQHV